MSGFDNQSPAYAVRHYRAMNEQEADALDMFLFHLEQEHYKDDDTFTLKELKALVDEYLGRDLPKIRRGEAEMLQNWIQAIKATGEKHA